MTTTSLLTTKVRPNWEELTRRLALRQARYWTALQLVLVLSTLLVLALGTVFPSWNWLPALWAVLFIPLAWIWPLATIYQATDQYRRSARHRTLAALGIVFAALAVVCAALAVGLTTAPLAFLTSPAVGEPHLPPVLGLAVPLLTWPLLAWTYRRFPLASRQMGLTPERWLANTAMGAAAGAALGLGLLLAVWPGGETGLIRPLAPATWAWLVAYEVGLRAPGEELLFRGLVYRNAVSDPSVRVARGVFRVILLNLLVYVVPLVFAATVEGRLGILVYGAALACTSTLLRHRQHSLLPGLAANIVFGMFLASCLR